MRTLKFEVTVPGIPETDQYSDEYVTAWLRHEISHPYDAAYEADVEVKLVSTTNPETYTAPEGYTWRYIGDCSCRGQDADHSANEAEWRLVPIDANPERDGNGCMVYRGPASQGA